MDTDNGEYAKVNCYLSNLRYEREDFKFVADYFEEYRKTYVDRVKNSPIENKLKVLDIFKNKAMNLISFDEEGKLLYDNEVYLCEDLTEEEVTLLKEWLKGE